MGQGLYLAPHKKQLSVACRCTNRHRSRGGNHASEYFVHSVERHGRVGERIISSKGKGLLRAANPIHSGVAPMNIVGSCDIPLVFTPEDRVRRMTVRVVEGLPYRLILGAAFLR